MSKRALNLNPINQVEDFKFFVNNEREMMKVQKVKEYGGPKVSLILPIQREIPFCDGAFEKPIRMTTKENLATFSMGAQTLVESDVIDQPVVKAASKITPTMMKSVLVGTVALGALGLWFISRGK